MKKLLGKKERAEIFKLFLESNKLRFNEIEKCLKIRSNMVSYHLTSMVKEGLLIKKGEYYLLTEHAEKYIPLFSDIFGMDVGPLPIILVAVVNKGKILFIKRNKRPYKDYWSMIGGKLLLHEDIKEAAIRQVKEKTGLDSEFISLNNIMHERVEGSGIVKHSFMLIFVKVSVKNIKFKETRAGGLKWFSVTKLRSDKVIPSDYWLIKHSLNKKIIIPRLYMHENEGIIESHRFL
jgi:ADP-ribose pyrophosphatase YjhB (NUDIX family)/DNA-binding HxlR family transcriptional regulator